MVISITSARVKSGVSITHNNGEQAAWTCVKLQVRFGGIFSSGKSMWLTVWGEDFPWLLSELIALTPSKEENGWRQYDDVTKVNSYVRHMLTNIDPENTQLDYELRSSALQWSVERVPCDPHMRVDEKGVPKVDKNGEIRVVNEVLVLVPHMWDIATKSWVELPWFNPEKIAERELSIFYMRIPNSPTMREPSFDDGSEA